MLPNISVLEPVGHGVIATFKVYYLYNSFMKIMRVLHTSDKMMEDYRQSYGNLEGINNIISKMFKWCMEQTSDNIYLRLRRSRNMESIILKILTDLHYK